MLTEAERSGCGRRSMLVAPDADELAQLQAYADGDVSIEFAGSELQYLVDRYMPWLLAMVRENGEKRNADRG